MGLDFFVTQEVGTLKRNILGPVIYNHCNEKSDFLLKDHIITVDVVLLPILNPS